MTELFGGLPEQAVPPAPGRGTPRLRQPERDQPGWQILALDDLVTPDHPVRAVWAFVQRLDLQPLHEAVKAREGRPGQAPAAPELLLALWLWATVEGSAAPARWIGCALSIWPIAGYAAGCR